MNETTQIIELHWLDWGVILLYGIGMFAVAFWAMRKVKDCGGFLLGKRKLGKLMMIGSTFAGGTNANHPMAVATATYQHGLSGLWLSLTWMLITPFFWMYPPVLRRLRIVTMVDLVQHRFGKTMATLFKVSGVVMTPISMGFGLKSAAIVIQVMTGGAITGNWALAVICVPTVLYTLMGGCVAAYATDVIQGLFIVILSFLMIPFAIHQAGGMVQLDAAISDSFTHLLSRESGSGLTAIWVFWFMIGILFSAVTSTGGSASGAKNEFAARSQVFGLIIKRFCTVGWGVVGLLAIGLFVGNDAMQAHLAANPNNVFPVVAGQVLPVVLRGLIVASMLAAVMSSLDSMMVGFAGVVVNNIYKEHFVKRGSAANYLLAARIFAVVGVLFGWLVASGVDSLVKFATIVEPLGGLTGVAILVAILWRRTTGWGAMASMAVMFPLFFYGANGIAFDHEALSKGLMSYHDCVAQGVATLPIVIRQIVGGMFAVYNLFGYHVNLQVPVEISYPLYLIPGVLVTVVVSWFTRQHSDHDVAEFYARLDTPVGEERALKAAGFHEDDLEGLDHEVVTVDAQDHDMSKRLLLTDLCRLPQLLRSGEAKLSDYKWDWYGLVGGTAFVVLFLAGVEWLGSLF